MNFWRYVMMADLDASYVAKHQMALHYSPNSKSNTTLRVIILRVYPCHAHFVRKHSGQDCNLNVTNTEIINNNSIFRSRRALKDHKFHHHKF